MMAMEMPYDAIYTVTQSANNYVSLEGIKNDYEVSTDQILFVGAFVNEQKTPQDLIGISMGDENTFGPNDLNLLPLACNPADESMVILAVPHLRSEIADDVFTQA